MKTFLAIACLLFTSSAASAKSLPSFNIQRRCLKLGMTPNMPTETIYYSCMAGEEQAYAHLYHWWADIAEETRNRCIAASGGSYVNLQRCMDSTPGVF